MLHPWHICDENRLETLSRQTKNFADLRWTYGLSALNNFSEHNMQQLMEIVYWHSTFSLSVLNIGLIHDLCKLMKFVYWRLTFRIFVHNLGSNHDSHQPKKIPVLVSLLPPNYAENRLETWLGRKEKFVNWRSNDGLSVFNRSSKHDSRQLMNFVYWHWIFSQTVLNIVPNVTRANWSNSCIGARNTVYIYWIWPPNITSAKLCKSWIGTRNSVYPC